MADETPMNSPFSDLAPVLQEDLKRLKGAWVWFAVLGVALIVLGVFALSYSVLFTIATVEIIGFFLILGGATFIAGSFFTGSWEGFFLTLMTGVLQLVLGLICVRHPDEAAIVYTLLMAAFFMVGGLFRIAITLSSQFHGRSGILVNGIITLALGIMIWHQIPFSGLWVIGTFLGIDLISNGWVYLLIGLSIRKLPV
jgi:uncharacterized membrane protein HdeD (DUF308 family)